MKNVINFFYNLNIDNIRVIDNNYYFTYDGKKFIFYEIRDVYFDHQATFELNSRVLNNNNSFYQIIPNKNNEILTYNANKKYILMLDKTVQDRNFDYFDVYDTNVIVNDNNKVINRLNRFNWALLWKSKVDYFEFYVNQNINKYRELNSYYNYFIGLAENAILYYGDTIDEEKPSEYDRGVVSHKRIEQNYSFKDLYNPVGLIVDHPSRDLAGYLKMIFWNNTYKYENIINYLNEVNLSSYGARMLISRMLFPSFFFDAFEALIDNKTNSKYILNIVDRMNEYEKYVLNIYKLIRNKYLIPASQIHTSGSLQSSSFSAACFDTWRNSYIESLNNIGKNIPFIKLPSSTGNKFNDILDEIYIKPINDIAGIGIINGVGPGLFNPDDFITRAEIAAIGIRTYDYILNTIIKHVNPKHVNAEFGYDRIIPVNYHDVDMGAWYEDVIEDATQLGLMKGIGDNLFDPDRAVNRAECVQVLETLFGKVDEILRACANI